MKVLAVVAVALAGLYGAYTWAFPSATVRYRLTIEVEADGEIRAGSSVVAVEFYKDVIGSVDPRTANVQLTGHSLGGLTG